MKALFLLSLTLLSISVQGQLLNKLKDKALEATEKAINTTKNELSNQSSPNSKSGVSNPISTNTRNETNIEDNWEPAPGDKKVFTLASDEKFYYDECKVQFSNSGLDYDFIISKNYTYTHIHNGTRMKTYSTNDEAAKEAKIKSAMRKKYGDESYENTNRFQIDMNEKDPVTKKYIKSAGSKYQIQFNGQSLGPYSFVSKVVPCNDDKKIWACVVNPGQTAMMAQYGMGNVLLINNEGKSIKCFGEDYLSSFMLISEDGQHAAIGGMNTRTQEMKIVSSSGKSQTLSMMAVMNGKSYLKVTNKGDIIFINPDAATEIQVNGNPIAAFKEPIQDFTNLYINEANYKESAYYYKKTIYKADGTTIPITGMSFPNIVCDDKGLQLYYFKIKKNSDNSKDVYLCKKTI